MRVVGEDRSAVDDRPPCDSLAVSGSRAEDLLRPLAAGEDGYELALGLVGLVDVQSVVRDELGQRVRDPIEQRVQAVL